MGTLDRRPYERSMDLSVKSARWYLLVLALCFSCLAARCWVCVCFQRLQAIPKFTAATASPEVQYGLYTRVEAFLYSGPLFEDAGIGVCIVNPLNPPWDHNQCFVCDGWRAQKG